MKKMSNFLDNIKLIASELANMSPKTQLEIVKLCKNLCLNVKDYLVELDETTLENITTRLDDLQDELTTAEGNIQANANAIDTINDTIDTINDALNNRYTKSEIDALLTSKINIQFIELSGGSGTLTESQLTDIINGQIIMIKRVNVFYYKSAESDTLIYFERLNFPSTLNEGVYHKTYERIDITKLTGAWTYTNVVDLDVYSKSKVDDLIAGIQPELPKRYLHKVHFTCVSMPNGPTFDVYIINNSSDSLNTYRKVFDYIDSTQKVVSMSGALYDSNNVMRILTSFKFDSATTCMYTYYNTSTNSYSSQNIVNISSFVISVQDSVTEIL